MMPFRSLPIRSVRGAQPLFFAVVGEALRQAMMEMLDRGGYADDSGKLMFAYAHPLFWAPYAIIGDGGAR